MKSFFSLIIICIFVMSFVFIACCISSIGYEGRYEYKDGRYIVLKSDKTFEATGYHGDYKIEGNQLSFCVKGEYGCIKVGKFENGNLYMITSNGDWMTYQKVK